MYKEILPSTTTPFLSSLPLPHSFHQTSSFLFPLPLPFTSSPVLPPSPPTSSSPLTPSSPPLTLAPRIDPALPRPPPGNLALTTATRNGVSARRPSQRMPVHLRAFLKERYCWALRRGGAGAGASPPPLPPIADSSVIGEEEGGGWRVRGGGKRGRWKLVSTAGQTELTHSVGDLWECGWEREQGKWKEVEVGSGSSGISLNGLGHAYIVLMGLCWLVLFLDVINFYYFFDWHHDCCSVLRKSRYFSHKITSRD